MPENEAEYDSRREVPTILNHDGSAMKDHRGMVVYRNQFLATHPLLSECQEKTGRSLGKNSLYMSPSAVIRNMNIAFGNDGWSSEITRERILQSDRFENEFCVGYMATVRITLKESGVSHEDCGSGEARDESLAVAHEHALESAISNALKKAARHFGERLGNAIYCDGGVLENAPVNNRRALEQLEEYEERHMFGKNNSRNSKNNRFSKPDNRVPASPIPTVSADDASITSGTSKITIESVDCVSYSAPSKSIFGTEKRSSRRRIFAGDNERTNTSSMQDEDSVSTVPPRMESGPTTTEADITENNSSVECQAKTAEIHKRESSPKEVAYQRSNPFENDNDENDSSIISKANVATELVVAKVQTSQWRLGTPRDAKVSEASMKQRDEAVQKKEQSVDEPATEESRKEVDLSEKATSNKFIPVNSSPNVRATEDRLVVPKQNVRPKPLRLSQSGTRSGRHTETMTPLRANNRSRTFSLDPPLSRTRVTSTTSNISGSFFKSSRSNI